MTPAEFRFIRKGLGLSQRAMAAQLGYAHAMRVTEIEAGKMAITPQVERLMVAYRSGYVPHDSTERGSAPQSTS